MVSTAITAPTLGGELPGGASVAAGNVSIGGNGNAMTVTQQSNTAIVNWNSFSVGQGQSVNFIQPSSSSAILNRVTGATRSSIAGAVTGNGQVYLINPNGIAITSSGSVKVGGGFVASTLDIKDEDFLKGKRQFTGNGNSAEVSNAGIISVGRGGYAALMGGSVKNDGLINVPVGKVGLGAAEKVTLDLSGDGFLQVAVPSTSGVKEALIQNNGTVSANGGAVIMTAATARNAVRNAINLSGVVEANSVGGQNGAITIGGGEGGNVAVSGTVTATAAQGNGGKVNITGDSIALAGAKVDVSGKTGGGTVNIGGGTVNIGGERQGKGSTQRATTTTLDASTVVKADAIIEGNGGNVVVWSDKHTRFAGNISARGAGAGNGGEAEVSGKATLAYAGKTDLSADSGKYGNLLLDPHNVIISSAADTGSGFSASADDSVINAGTLQGALALANVTVSTGSSGTQSGDITVASNIGWSADTTLTLEAAGNIALNGNIAATGTNAGLALNYGSGKDYTLLSGKSVTLSGANSSLSIGGESYTLIRSMAQLDAIDTTGLSGRYALAQNVNANGTTYSNALVGTSSGTAFSGIFTGLGNTLSNLKINSADTYVGLFGYNTGTIRNVALTAAQLTGSSAATFYAGLLAAYNTGTVAYASAAGSLTRTSTATTYMGGLVGQNIGTVKYSHSGANITAINSSNGSYWGGLVGQNNKDILQSYADGTINLSGTSGNGSQNVGGLVGNNAFGAKVNQSYSAANITASGMGGAASFIGGLVGYNAGALNNVYTTSTLNTGINSWAGGLVGYNASGTVANSYAAAVFNYSTPPSFYGGLIGYNGFSTLQNLYWNTQTSSSVGVGSGSSNSTVVGLTTAQMKNASNFSGLDSTVWAPASGSASPALFGFSGVVGVAQNAVYGATPTTTYYGAGFWNAISGRLTNGLQLTDNVGVHTLSTAGLTAINASGQAASIISLGGTVTPALLTITANNTSKVYGSSFPFLSYTASGLVNGDYITSMGYTSLGFSSTANVGSYSLAVSGAGGVGLSNYTISYNSGALNVTPAALTISADNASKIYGNSANLGYSAAGLVNGDTVDGLALTSAGNATSATVGSYGIAASNATGSKLGNYTISYNDGTLTVTPAALTISADNASKIYGNSANLGYTTEGLVNGDAVNELTLTSVGNATTANVGSYSIAASNATGTGLGNYTISYNNGTLTVTPAALTISADNASKIYGSSANLGYTTEGLVNGDTVDGLTLTSAGNAASATVGSYGIAASNASGTGLGNYTISYNNGTLSVTPAALTISADNASKIYGNSANLGYTTAGLVNGDTVDGLMLTSAGNATSANVGSYGIAASNATGTGLGNYTISYNDGTLTVTPAALTISADNASKIYGNSANLGYTAAGLVNGDKVDGLTLTSSGNAASANVGSYGIAASNATGSKLGNYTISYNNGTLTVTPAALTISADNASKVYGNSANLGYTAVGLVNGDTVNGLTLTSAGNASTANVGSYGITASDATGSKLGNYTISYNNGTLTVTPAALTISADNTSKIYGNSANLGYTTAGLVNGDTVDGLTLTSTGNASTANVGSYGITASDATGSKLGNYTISYNDGALTVTPAALTISADNASKLYGQTATLGYQANGLLNGDTVESVTVSSSGADRSAAVGQYAVVAENALGDRLANYNITYVNGALTVDLPIPTDLPLAANIGNRFATQNLTQQITGSSMVVTHDATTASTASGQTDSSSANNDVMATVEPRLAGAVCMLGADYALSCSGK
ncbi:MBG domain-containing protein [Candidatus Symbiopectobacterium sp. NZEC151]|uniref:MBG domain-containing protein n=2 Tax=unclassified Symbiopectobacterium TaxID=2794573 RepID=UPI002226F54D|nr:MBG domain-containing protein [Candidatus Symbiopectobacterium sp. NZEC151]